MKQAARPPRIFTVGDRIPNFRLPDRARVLREVLGEVSGRPALFLLLPKGLSSLQQAEWLEALSARSGALAESGAEAFVIVGTQPGYLPAPELGALPHWVLADQEGGQIALALGERQGPRLFVTDGNQRIVAAPETDGAQAAVEAAYAAVTAYRAGRAAEGSARPAPVLILENLLTPAHCRRLIAAWEAEHHEGAVSAGGSENFYDHKKKRNLEHVVSDRDLLRDTARVLSRRMIPEIAKAFAYAQPYDFETFIVLGYQVARQDFFGVHRDRYTQDQPRRFAMSLNLNDDFEGGYLRFPEYSDALYRPPAGGGAIFSCSLLHEALPVTKGRRLTMTTFVRRRDLSEAERQESTRRTPQPANQMA